MKKYFLGTITGILLTIIIGASASYLYQAKDIEFNAQSSEFNATNVEDAINEINKNNQIYKKHITFLVEGNSINKLISIDENKYTYQLIDGKYRVNRINNGHCVRTKTKIDLTNYSKVIMNYSNLSSSSINAFLLVAKNDIESSVDSATNDISNAPSDQLILDVSDLTGEYYIFTSINNGIGYYDIDSLFLVR